MRGSDSEVADPPVAWYSRAVSQSTCCTCSKFGAGILRRSSGAIYYDSSSQNAIIEIDRWFSAYRIVEGVEASKVYAANAEIAPVDVDAEADILVNNR